MAKQGIDITYELAGDKALNKQLGLVQDLVEDFRPAWVEVARATNDFHEAVFKNEGRHGGFSKWAPLKESTKRQKRTDKILTETGRLRKSMTKNQAKDAIRVFKKKVFEWGTVVPYAGYHQTGTKKMAKRSPLRINKRLTKVIIKTIQKFYFDQLKRVAKGDLGLLAKLKRQARFTR